MLSTAFGVQLASLLVRPLDEVMRVWQFSRSPPGGCRSLATAAFALTSVTASTCCKIQRLQDRRMDKIQNFLIAEGTDLFANLFFCTAGRSGWRDAADLD